MKLHTLSEFSKTVMRQTEQPVSYFSGAGWAVVSCGCSAALHFAMRYRLALHFWNCCQL